MRTRQATLARLDQADVLAVRCRELLLDGQLVLARTILCDYLLLLLDARMLLCQCDTGCSLLDAVNHSICAGQRCLAWLDMAIDEGETE